MANRNDVGVRCTTRTGPSHGPGMRTTYSSPTSIPPDDESPPSSRDLTNTAASSGAAVFGSAASCATACSGVIREPVRRTA